MTGGGVMDILGYPHVTFYSSHHPVMRICEAK